MFWVLLGDGTPLQYSCLGNPMEGGAWWAAVRGVGESWTRLSDFTVTFHFSLSCIGEGNGNSLQCSCLENPRDGGAWRAAVYGVAQSRTRLKRLGGGSSRLAVLHLKHVQGIFSLPGTWSSFLGDIISSLTLQGLLSQQAYTSKWE